MSVLYSDLYIYFIAACTEPAFECTNGQILSVEYRCDDYPDCFDGSDEVGCGT